MQRFLRNVRQPALWQSLGQTIADQVRRALLGEQRSDAVDALVIEPRILYSATPLPIDFDGDASPSPDVAAELDHLEVLLAEYAAAPFSAEADPVETANVEAGGPFAGGAAANEGSSDVDRDIAAEGARQHEIVFIDAGLADRDSLLASFRLDAAIDYEFVIIEGGGDGVRFVADVLAERGSQYDAIHLVTHGGSGFIQIGGTEFGIDDLADYAADLDVWGNYLTVDGDILVYGCEVAAGPEGDRFLRALADATGADVAASADLTGHVDLGGDWLLEAATGRVETGSLVAQGPSSWRHVLATITVTTFADENSGDTSSIAALQAAPGQTGISLREAITAANNTAGDDTIVLSAGTYTLTITGSSGSAQGDLDVSTNITITGAGMSSTTINANSIDRIFETDSSGVLALSDLRVTGGYTATQIGGGLQLNAGTSMTLTRVLVDNNSTANYAGGGIHNVGTFSATDSIFRNNSSGSASAGGLYNSGTMTLTRVSVVDNSAGGSGGGLLQAGGTLNVSNSTFSGNSASGGGGGMYFSSGTATVTYSTITSNTTTSPSGGGLSANGGTINLGSNVIANNTAGGATNPDLNGSYTSQGYNVVKQGSFTGSVATDKLGVDPSLAARSVDAASGQYVHALNSGSVAVNAGGGTPPASDQRGVTRNYAADAGAYELVTAPVLNNLGVMSLTTISESATSNAGDTVAAIIASAGGDRITDADGDPEGIAVNAAASGNGTWQYSINNGTTWIAVGAVSDSSALLLRSTDKLRFVPNAINGGATTIAFRAWDQRSGTAGTKVSTSSNGGTTAFSTAVETATVTVTESNSTPTAASNFYSLNEDSSRVTTWWSTAWLRRSVITFTGNNFAGAENMTDFPVLVAFNASNIDYSMTQNAGQDLRFFDADGTALAYEVENWNESGTSYVWVRVPVLSAGSSDSITVYFGNSSAAAGEDPAAVWNSSFKGVYHFDDPASIVEDATAFNRDGVLLNGAAAAAGRIGGSASFDGSNDYIDLGSARDYFSGGTSATVSAWINTDTLTGGGAIFGSSRNNGGLGTTNSRFAVERVGSNIEVLLRSDDSTSQTVTTTTNALVAGNWHHVVAVVDVLNDTVQIYIDGVQQATTAVAVLPGNAFASTSSDSNSIGSNETGSTPFFTGRIDEVRALSSGVSAAWVKANYLAANGTFLTVGAAEVASGSSGVLGNDTDADGTRLTATLVSGPSNAASFVFNKDGTFTYTPTANFSGTDTFTYRVSDGTANSSDATVTLNVANINDAPVVTASGGAAAYVENASPSVVDAAFTVADIDSADFSGGQLTVSIASNGTANDRLVIVPGGLVTRLGNSVLYNGTVIGTVAGGDGTTPLVLTFNASSSPTAAQAVARQVSYFNVSDDPSTLTRSIAFTLSDGDGDTSGTVLKSLTLTAAADAPRAYDDNSSLRFDGIDDRVDMGSAASLVLTDNFTLETTIRPTGYPASSNIILNKEGEYELGLSSTGILRWAFANTSPGWNWLDTGYTVALNEWSRIAVTYSSGTVQTYVNGNLVHTYYGSGTVGDSNLPLNNLLIGGRQSNPSGQYFAGDIDEVRIWNVVRSQSEVRTALDQGLVGNEAGLISYWRFNEGGGTTTADLTANANHGVLVDGGGGTAGPQWTGFGTTQNASLNVTAVSGLLRNDFDGEANPLTIAQVNGLPGNVGVAITLTSGATATVQSDGSFAYNPGTSFNYLAAGQSAFDSFTYQVSDGNGGTDTATAYVRVSGLNDAPTLTSYTTSYAMTEDDTVITTVASLISGLYSDVDSGSSSGAAFTAVSGSGASIDYSLDGGTTWQVFSSISSTNALLLRSTDQVRIIGNMLNGGAFSVSYRGWDRTSGTAGNYTDASVGGGTTAFSSNVNNVNVTLTSVNDAPVLDNAGTMSFTTISEDQTNNAGQTVAAVLASAGGDRLTDVDSGAVEGIAITGHTPGTGTWQYSLDGGTSWQSVGSVANTSALLLRSSDLIRFVPDGQNATSGDITFRGWDQASGTAGTKVDTSTNGGTTAFSTASETAAITVTAVNDAPVLDNTAAMSLTTLTEEQTNNAGQSVASVLSSAGGDRLTDVDGGAVEGIAITGLNSGNGAWQYSIDGGTSWQSVGSVSDTSALLLRSSDLLRFVPNGQNATSGDITFRGWDQTAGTTGTKVDTSTNGGTTAFSTATETAEITVTAVNDAPVLDNTGTMTLTTITEDQTNNTGNSIASIIVSAGGDRLTDVDSGAGEGIALTGHTSGTGTWQYSLDGGTSWQSVGSVSDTSALLLRSSDLLRFVPNGQNATSGDITFRGWDQTAGTTGTKVDTSTNGGTTAFSTATETATITVTAVNDAPTITSGNSYSLTGTNEDTTSSGTLASAILTGANWADVDSAAVSGIAITATTGTGGWQYSTDGVTWNGFGAVGSTNALLITSTTQVRYVPDGQNGETATFTYKAWDRTSGTASSNAVPSYATTTSSGGTTAFSSNDASTQLVVSSVNDAPVLDNSGTMTLPTITKLQIYNGGAEVAAILASTGGDQIADVDAGAVEGIAITTLASGNGTWQYSLDGGVSWTSVGAVSISSALLLRSTDFVRFVPNGTSGTTASFDFRAWDQSGGTAGTKVSVATTGGTTAFSTAAETATIVVVDVNAAPVLDSSKSPTLGSINEDAGAPTGVVGRLVSSLVDFANPSGQVDNVTDADGGAGLGIVVTGADTTNGTWFYTINNGATWNTLGAVSDSNARHLTADANTRLYFQANANYHGSLANAITFRAWDQTSGVNGGLATVSTTATVRDEFSAIAYSNNNGTQFWDSSWYENDSLGGGAAGGRITVAGGKLQIQAASAGNSIYREVDLSDATNATLSFDYSSGLGGSATVVVQASSNEGASYTTLAGGTFNASANTGNGTASFDVSPFISANTRFRFLIVSGETGAGNNSFNVDNVQVQFNTNGGGTSAYSKITDVANLTVNPLADMPSITGATTNEDTQSSSGLVISRNVVDGAEVTHFKITGVTNGSLYKNDGVTLVTNGSFITFAEGSAGLKFTPAADFNGTGNFTVQASTSNNDAGLGGNTVLASVTVNAVNDAPTLDNGGTMTLSTITEEQITNGGNSIASIIASAGGDRITDVDSGAIEGIAITGLNSGNGAWQYSVDGGTSWQSVGSVSDASALLLRSSDLIRFVPNGQNATSGDITFRGWDRTAGTTGTKADTSTNGGTTAFSTASETAAITVTAVNDAPVLDNTGTMSFTTITEDQTNNAGQSVATVLASAGGDRVTDVDSGAVEGIAITGHTSGTGTWQYSLNGGTTWTAVGTVADSSALLLSSTDLLRFVPNGQNATSGDITFRGWDQTAGTTGTKVDTSTNGGTTAFSTATETAAITVTAVNDAPVLDNSGTMSLTTITEEQTNNAGQSVASVLSSAGGDRLTDVDGGAVEGIAITGLNSGNGAWQYSIDGGTSWQSVGSVSDTSGLLLRSSDLLRFVPNGQDATSGDITFRGWDQTAGTTGTKVDTSTNGGTTAFSTATETAAITVTAVNDAPVLDNSGTMTLTTITEDQTNHAGQTIASILASGGGDRLTDVDGGAVEGIALTGLNSGNGAWQYSVDGGTSWQATGTVSNASALLLGSSDLLRFVPDGQNATSADITFRGWDQTSGTNGSKVDTSTGGGSSAFSTATETASISVTAVNDAPTATADTGTADESGGYGNATAGADATGNVLSNDSDVDAGDTRTVTGVAAGAVGSASGGVGSGVTGSFGSITIAANGAFVYAVDEANATVQSLRGSGNTLTDTFTYTITDSAGGQSSTQVVITIRGANNAPTAAADAATATEGGGTANASGGVNPSGNVLTNDGDVDAGDSKSVTGVAAGVAGSASGNVGAAVGGTYGSITINASGGYTYTVDNSNATVQALRTASDTLTDTFTYTMTDAAGLTSTTQVTVTIRGNNDVPTDITSGGFAVSENAANGTAVGSASGVDQDTSETLSYSLTDNAGGRFAINASTGAVTVADGSLLDRESASTHSITVRVTDAGGLSYDEAFTVTISDVDEFDAVTPADVDAAANFVDENSAIGTAVGITAASSDADATTNAITYSLTDSDSGRFAVNASTGVVTVAGALDREAIGASRSITVRATSADGSYADQSFTVAIGDVDEFDATTPADVDAAANFVAENSAIGTVVGITAASSDADAATNAITYSLTDNEGGRFAVNASSGVVTVAGALDRETLGASRSITVRATSVDGSYADQSFTIAIGDVDEFDAVTPTDVDAAANFVAENSAIGTVVGITAASSDADATTNAITYSLTDSDSGRFAVNASTGVVTVAGALDREAIGASRSITVRATSADGSYAEESFTVAIGDVDEFDAATPADVDAAANFVAENSAIGTVVGITAASSDADATTNAITYSLTDNDSGRFAVNASSGVVTVAGALDRETLGASRSITVRATSVDGSYADQSFTIAIGDVDEFDAVTPADVDAAANFVAENSAIGTVVGITAASSDADATTNAITYSLTDSDSGRFAVNASTGVVTVAGALDREAIGASRSITVRATSADGSYAEESFTVAIGDVDEFDAATPADVDAAANFVAENSAIGTVVGITAASSDADATTNAITYSLTDSDSGRFAVNASTGVVTVAGALDRESIGASRSITVRATSGDGSYADQSFTIAIGDVDEFDVAVSTDANAAANAVSENAAIGTVVGITAASSDADATTNTVTYSIVDSDGGRFAVNSSSGVVTVAGTIDREAIGASRSITVRATSADGSYADQSFTIAIGDVDEFDAATPADVDAAANFVAENSAIGTVVGITAASSDADATTNAIAYSLTDSDSGRFAVNASTGVVTVAGALDRESIGASRSITIRATSADGSYADQSFTIAIGDVDEFDVAVPTDANAAANAVSENAAIGTTVGLTVASTDSDATTNTVTYSIVDSDGGRFAVNASSGVVTVAGALDREAIGASRSITVRATSADGSYADQSFTIAIVDVDEFDAVTPADVEAAANFVAENSAIGTAVGITAASSDADATTNAITYSLTDSDSGRFAVNASTGVVTVAGALNREVIGPSRSITVRATSADGSYAEESFTIAIGDVDEFDAVTPTDVDAAANFVAENSAIGTVVGITAASSDADAATNAITYSLADNDSGRFAVDASTGVVTVAGSIDREAIGATRTITVRATSADGSYADSNFSVAIGDVDEFDVAVPTDANAAANAVSENAAIGATVGLTVASTDSDATTNTVTYSIVDSDGGRFAVNASSGVVTVAGALDREAIGASRSITVRATSADGSFADQSFTIAIVDVDEFDAVTPADVDAAADFVAENSAIGTVVGITAASSDADATTNAIAYSLTDSDGGRFAVNASNGVVTVAGALDRESIGASRSITIRATSADGSYADQSFTIAIGDVDEFDVAVPTDANAAANAVSENAAIGTTVGLTVASTDSDATTNTVTYSIVDSDGGRFAVNASSGVVTVAGALDREAIGASRSITVRATSADGSYADQSFTIAIVDVDEFDAVTPADVDAAANFVAENSAIGTAVGITAASSDADATTSAITYSLTDSDSGRFAVNASTGVVTVAGALDRESIGPSRSITVRATSADGSYAEESFTIAIGDVDEFDAVTPTDVDAAANFVAENSAIGTVVGVTAASSDADATTNAITYSLTDNDGGRFAVNASSGVVTVAGALDRETLGASRSITVRATSVDGSYADQSFTIAIVDVDEFDAVTPADVDAAANFVAENSAIGTAVGITAASSDADATTNAITYSLTDSDSGRFAVNASTGVVSVAGALDRESIGASRSITVRATSADGSYAEESFTIAIGDVDEFDAVTPADVDAAANFVVENSAIGTVVGVTAASSDADATTNAITYSLTDSDSGRFAVDATTGVVTVAGSIDREAIGRLERSPSATSADGSYADRNFTVAIGDVDEFDVGAVSDSQNAANFVAENASIGTTVGLVAFAEDADATNDVITYTLQDDSGGRFSIDAATGVVRVAGSIDREADGPTRSVMVRATSEDGSFTEQGFTITIGDVDEFDVVVPTDTDNSLDSISENAAVGTTVGVTAFSFDADATTNGITYSMVNSDSGRFAVDAATGVVTVAGAIDRESLSASRTIVVRASSADGSFADRSYSIAIVDVDEFDVTTPVDGDASANFVLENSSIGTAVGITASASDADATNNAVAYSLVDADGGRFSIDSLSGIVRVAAALDREALGGSRSIVIRATCSDGSIDDQSFTVSIGDVDEFDLSAISDAATAADAVDENAANGTAVGVAATAIDFDATTNTVSYSLTDDAGGRFMIDATTGVVRVADGSLLDAETRTSHSITVVAVSSDGSTSSRSFTIAVRDVDEFDVSSIVDVNPTANAVDENAAIGTFVGYKADAFDADLTTNAVTYSLINSDSGRFAIDASTGQVRVAGAIDFETLGGTREIVIRASSADGSFTTRTVQLTINDLNEAPKAAALSYTTNYLNAVTPVGQPMLATAVDPDGDALTAVLVNGPSAGTLVFSPDGSFVFTPKVGFPGAYTFSYYVTDGQLRSADQVVTINVIYPPIGSSSGSGGSNGGSSGSGGGSATSAGTGGGAANSAAGGGSTTSANGSQPQNSSTPSDAGAKPISAASEVALPGDMNNEGKSQGSKTPSGDASANGTPRTQAAGGADQKPTNQFIAAVDTATRFGEGGDDIRIASLSFSTSGRQNISSLGGLTPSRPDEILSWSGSVSSVEALQFEETITNDASDKGDRQHFEINPAVVGTMIGTGIVIWSVQAVGVFATFMSAAPVWMQLDPLVVMNEARGDRTKEDENDAAVRMFNQRRK